MAEAIGALRAQAAARAEARAAAVAKAEAAGKARRDFYSSTAWRRLRYRVLRENALRHGGRPQCELCGSREGPFHADHVVPVSRDWSRRLDPTNVQPLCASCNMGKGASDRIDWREPVAGGTPRFRPLHEPEPETSDLRATGEGCSDAGEHAAGGDRRSSDHSANLPIDPEAIDSVDRAPLISVPQAAQAMGVGTRSVFAWWIGDWWKFGERRFRSGKELILSEEWEGPGYQSVLDAGYVCKSVPISRRREVLTFAHHREVASLPPGEADGVLDWAEETISETGKPRSTRAVAQ